MLSPRNLAFFGALAVGLTADQLTKAWVERNLGHLVDEVQIVDGWFSLVHAQNTGAAFSTMEGQRPLFLVFAVIAVIVIFDLFRRQPRDEWALAGILGTILSGAMGNGLDRLFKGHVTDFLKVYAGHEPLRGWFVDRFHTNVWPIFNVADSMLLVGALLFAAYWFFQREGEIAADEVAPETPPDDPVARDAEAGAPGA